MTASYERFYNLTADPFSLTPDQRVVFAHSGYQRARAKLQYALHCAEGFVVILGAWGSGKTSLIQETLASIDEGSIFIASLLGSRSEPQNILQMVGTALGVQCDGLAKPDLVLQIKEVLAQRYLKQQRVILLIEEAHAQPLAALEQLRILSDIGVGSQSLLQLFLIGQERLDKYLECPEMKPLRQRIVATVVLSPLSPEETAGYVSHRLEQAGWEGGPLFSAAALRSINERGGGIPRLINRICSRLLSFGANQGKRILDARDVDAVLVEKRREELRLLGHARDASTALCNQDRYRGTCP